MSEEYLDTRILTMCLLYGTADNPAASPLSSIAAADCADCSVTCSSCPNFVTKPDGHVKCAVFGIGNGKATDWCGSFPACGHYSQKRMKGETPVREICRTTRRPRKKESTDDRP